MLEWKISKIRYAADKLTLTLVNHTDPVGRKELDIVLEMYNGELHAVARIGKDVIWANKVIYKHFDPST